LAFQRRFVILYYDRFAKKNGESAVMVGDESLQIIGMGG
jgi:hypothetical protein